MELTERVEIAHTLGVAIKKHSSSENYSKEFQSIKTQMEEQKINFKTSRNFRYDKKFTMRDLKRSLKKSNNSSPRPDQIHYEIWRHFAIETLHVSLDIINEILKMTHFLNHGRKLSIFQFPNPERISLIPLIIVLLLPQVAYVKLRKHGQWTHCLVFGKEWFIG